jgi:hypothetical protein
MTDENSRETVRVFIAPDPVIAGMVKELLQDAGFPAFIKSDDFLGIGGFSANPQIYCQFSDHEAVIALLKDKGFIEGKE